MVLDFTIDPQEAIKVEAASPVDEPELSLYWVKEKAEAGRDLFQKFKSQCEVLDDFFLNDFDFGVPENGTMVRLGTAQSVINTLVSHVSPQFLDVSVPHRGQEDNPAPK